MGTMADRLDRYRAKRDFERHARTRRGGRAGRGAAVRRAGALRARDALGSAARARGHAGSAGRSRRASRSTRRRNNLAVQTEDHPLEYLDFHGEIPEGNYGAGTMKIFDRGTFEVHKWRDKEVMVTFHGERVRGKYVLFRDGRQELDDPPDGPAGGPDARAAARTGSSRCSRAPGELPRRRGLGVRDQVGRRARDRLHRGRAAAEAREPQQARTSRRATRSCASWAARSAPTRRSSTARSSPSRTALPSFQRLQKRMHLTSRGADAPALADRARRLHRSSTCCGSTATRCSS